MVAPRSLVEWFRGEAVTENCISVGIECSRCQHYCLTKRKNHICIPVKNPDIRFFEETHGFLCRRCFDEARTCVTKGCTGLAVVEPEGLCRGCYIKEEIVSLKDLENLIWRQKECMYDIVPELKRCQEDTKDEKEK